jgi:hypothetical protein
MQNGFTANQQLTMSKFLNKRPPTQQADKTAGFSRRPPGLTVDTSKAKPLAIRNISDFSPMTPSKTIAVRFNPNLKMSSNLDALKSP